MASASPLGASLADPFATAFSDITNSRTTSARGFGWSHRGSPFANPTPSVTHKASLKQDTRSWMKRPSRGVATNSAASVSAFDRRVSRSLTSCAKRRLSSSEALAASRTTFGSSAEASTSEASAILRASSVTA